MNGNDRMRHVVAVAALLAASNNVLGQWIDRTHEIHAGWNAVYLEIDPSPAGADSLFAGLPIEEVWARARQLNIQGPPDCADPNDPNCVPSVASDWDVWLPPSDPNRVVTNLRTIRGGQAYLIRAASPTTLSLEGTPNPSVAKWQSGFNLGGMHVEDDPAAAPTFEQYFAGSTAFSSLSVFEFFADGSPSPIANPGSVKIEPGTGYWISSSGDTEYDGPIKVDNGSLRGVDFAVSAVEHGIQFENQVANPRVVEATYVSSSGVPVAPPDLPANAGDVPLTWLEYVSGPAASALQWHTLTTATWNLAGAGRVRSENGAHGFYPAGVRARSHGREPVHGVREVCKPWTGDGRSQPCLRPAGALSITRPRYHGLAPVATCHCPYRGIGRARFPGAFGIGSFVSVLQHRHSRSRCDKGMASTAGKEAFGLTKRQETPMINFFATPERAINRRCLRIPESFGRPSD